MQPDIHKIAKEFDVTYWRESPADDGRRWPGFLPFVAAEKATAP